MELCDYPAYELALLLRQRSVSAVDIVESCLRRIEMVDGRPGTLDAEPREDDASAVHAFITLTAERALAQARDIDRRLAAGEEVGPLAGIPFTVKDIFAVRGTLTTAASRILSNFVAPYTATAVSRLEEAGAIMLGKVNLDEFTYGSSNESTAFKPAPRNPWNLSRVPGGSSGGSVASVAAGEAPLSLGTDTSGSIRLPAAYCGVVGLKPTYGRVSRFGLIAFGSSLDCVGVLARTAVDAALLLEVMAGHDPLDATSLDAPVPRFRFDQEPDLRGLRVGVPKEFFIEGMQPEVESAVRAAVARLADLGAEVIEISLPHTDLALPVYYLIAPAEASANLSRYDGVRYGLREPAGALWDQFKDTRGAGFGPEVKRRIMLGTYALSAGYYDAYYGQAQKVRTLIKRDFETAFTQVDLIATPVAPSTAFRLGEHRDDPLSMYLEDVFTLPVNLAGVPGLALPVGFDGQGLPVGMQLLGPHLGEEVLFRVGHAYQQVTDWHLRRPPLD